MQMSCQEAANKSLKNCHRLATRRKKKNIKNKANKYKGTLLYPTPTLQVYSLCLNPVFCVLCPVPTINVAISRNHETHANETAAGEGAETGEGEEAEAGAGVETGVEVGAEEVAAHPAQT